MQKLKTVRDKVASLSAGNGKLTETDQEAAQILAESFGNVLVQEKPLASTEDNNNEQQCPTEHLEIEITLETVRKKIVIAEGRQNSGS